MTGSCVAARYGQKSDYSLELLNFWGLAHPRQRSQEGYAEVRLIAVGPLD